MKILTIDCETNGLNPLAKDIIGFSIKYDNEPALYYSIDDLLKFKEELESPNIIKVAWNLKFEYQKLKQYGIEIKPPYFDAQIAFWLLQKGVFKKNKKLNKWNRNANRRLTKREQKVFQGKEGEAGNS